MPVGPSSARKQKILSVFFSKTRYRIANRCIICHQDFELQAYTSTIDYSRLLREQLPIGTEPQTSVTPRVSSLEVAFR